MPIGPIQMIVIGYDSSANFKGEVMRELQEIRNRGLIRVLDLLFVLKNEDGTLTGFVDSDMPAEGLEWGTIISQIMALSGVDESPPDEAGEVVEPLTHSDIDFGLTVADVMRVAEQLEPGNAVGILLFEHTWAQGLSAAIREAGGRLIAQGMLTAEAIMLAGEELQAVTEAKEAIETARAVKGAAILEALQTVAEANAIEEAAQDAAVAALETAEMVKTMAAAEAIRALIAADLIRETAALEAIETLLDAGLVEATTLEEAEDVVEQAEAVAAAALKKAETDDDDDDTDVTQPA